MLNLRQIEAFKAIMECGSITRAAELLHVSQPAVTKSLQLLEHNMGLRLFSRSPKGLIPTYEARAFYTEVERSFSGLSSLARFAQDLRTMRHERLVVSVIPALSLRWLPDAVSSFLSTYPDTSLTFQAASSSHTPQLVGQRHIDLGIAQSRLEDPSMERIPLMNLPLVCVMPAGHDLAKNAFITAEDLRGQKFIGLSPQDVAMVQLQQRMNAAGIELIPQIEVALALSVFELVSRGLGVGIIDAESAGCRPSPTVIVRPFQPALSMPVFILRLREEPTSMLAEKFIEHICGSGMQLVAGLHE